MHPARLLVVLSLLVSGCAAAMNAPVGTPPATAATTALGQFHWQLESTGTPSATAGQPPLQLDFRAGQLRVSHACNAMGSSYRVDGRTLHVDAIVSTMMACRDPVLNRRGRTIKTFLRGPLTFAVKRASGHMILTLTNAGGTTLVFVGQPRTGH